MYDENAAPLFHARHDADGYSPGPWRVFGGGAAVRAECGVVAMIYGGLTGDELRANARLIAAAPDLLDAVVLARKHIELEVERVRAGERLHAADLAALEARARDMRLVEVRALGGVLSGPAR